MPIGSPGVVVRWVDVSVCWFEVAKPFIRSRIRKLTIDITLRELCGSGTLSQKNQRALNWIYLYENGPSSSCIDLENI